uniref:protein disulfide-isomerase n=1 Tax=Tetraselmis sp. GSL018 TaxID=582737 RepID=A0A061QIT2_9CHLO|mmetsp:Transcript_6541/g.15720  ORF Transcript_6541/g.15720 Transcript_6541/m.15720 type:complete len:451 (-) Transcript_6541:2575-3927(-)
MKTPNSFFVRFILLSFAFFELSAGLYSSGGPVEILDSSNFKKSISGDGIWLVEFYAPWCGHCKALKPEWEKAAQALKGVVHVAAVDADQHRSLAGQYGIQGFPTIKLITVQNGKAKTSDYNGGRTAQEIAKFAMDNAVKLVNSRLGVKGSGSSSSSSGGGGSSGFYKGTDVVSLSSGNFDDLVAGSGDLWMVEFYAPWCGHCKALKPEWIEAARQLKDKVKVGAVNCDEDNSLCGKFGVQGFPTIKYFGPDKEKPQDYDSGRDSGSIVAYAMSRWEKFAPAAEVRELTDQEVLEAECAGRDGDASVGLEPARAKTLCVVAFLPHILDTKAEGRNAYIEVLKDAAESFKGRPFSFLWAEGGKQPALEANVEVGGFGYPAVVAISPSKGRFATMKGALEKGPLKTFIDNIRKGGEKTAPLQGALAQLEAMEPWDGQDAASYEEDEFDLSELD